MRKGFGMLCLVGGVLLLVYGYQTAESFKGQMHRIFTSSTDNKTTWLYVSGAVLATVGIFQVYAAKK